MESVKDINQDCNKLSECSTEDIETSNDYELHDADPKCCHELDPECLSGIKCKKCGGWFCF